MNLSEVLRELRKDLPLDVADRETRAEDPSLTYGLRAIEAALEAQRRGDEDGYFFLMRDAFSVAREWNNKSDLAGRVVEFYSLAKKRRSGAEGQSS